MTPLSPCPHRELLPGPLATPADLAEWAAAMAATECAACALPLTVEPVEPLPTLPPEVAAALRQEGRVGARAAQATIDAAGVPEALLPAVAARLSEQPGTCAAWRRWWAGWRGGALVAC